MDLGDIIMSITALTILGCFAGLIYFSLNVKVKYSNNYEKLKILGVVFLVMCAGYGCLIITRHFSVDSFNLLFDMSAYWNLQLGRWGNCGILLLAEQFGISQVVYQQVFAVLWILSATALVFMISDVIWTQWGNTLFRERCIIALFVCIAFVNVFYMEFLLFPEVFIHNICGNLALGLSIWFVFTRLKPIIKWILSFIFLFITLGNYQSYIGIYVAFVFIGIFIGKDKTIKEKVINLFETLICGGLASVGNVLLLKLLIQFNILPDSGRGVSLSLVTLLNNISELAAYQISFWKNADGLMGILIMPLAGMLLLVGVISAMTKLKKKDVMLFGIMMICSYILAYAPHLIESGIFLSPRSNIAIWSVLSGIFIVGYLFFSESGKKLFFICYMLFLGCNIFFMQDIAANQSAVNAADFVESKQICSGILAYEEKTGNKVEKIAMCTDVNPTLYQSFSRYNNRELGKRIMITMYSNYRLLGVRLNRSLEKTDMPEEIYNMYFQGKDWDCLNLEEQLVFDGNTMYLAIY